MTTLVFLKVSCSPVDLALEGAWKGWKETHTKDYLEVSLCEPCEVVQMGRLHRKSNSTAL